MRQFDARKKRGERQHTVSLPLSCETPKQAISLRLLITSPIANSSRTFAERKPIPPNTALCMSPALPLSNCPPISDEEEDGLAPARGIAYGIGLSALMWTTAFLLWRLT